ncbi:MAG: Ig-like domain-containing protein, partial [Spirochaetes bacterium]|nr:Ig-like domain-containing protein [Spirochaetota bacterium]
MDRRMRPCIRAALLAAIALATLLLGTCSETNIVALLTSEVKRANNKFLKVDGVKNPTAQTDVNPGVQMRIDFDRAVDPTTISADTVLISGPGTFTLARELSEDNKVLYVQPNPYLSSLEDYTLTLTTGIKSALGEELELPYDWTFKTGTYPAGTVTVTVSQAEVAYTNLLSSELTIKCN